MKRKARGNSHEYAYKEFDTTTASDPEMAKKVLTLCQVAASQNHWYRRKVVLELPECKALLDNREIVWCHRVLQSLLELHRHESAEFERLENFAKEYYAKKRSIPHSFDSSMLVTHGRYVDILITALCRRNLQLPENLLGEMIQAGIDNTYPNRLPSVDFSSVLRQVEFRFRENTLSPEIQSRLRAWGEALEKSAIFCQSPISQKIKTLLDKFSRDPSDRSNLAPARFLLRPAPVGHPHVLVELKRYLGIFPTPGQKEPIDILPPDAFPLHPASPLAEEHRTISEFLGELVNHPHEAWPALIERQQARVRRYSPPRWGRMYLASCERWMPRLLDQINNDEPVKPNDYAFHTRNQFHLPEPAFFRLEPV